MNHAIIVAAGSSKRMGEDKALVDLSGKPLIAQTIGKFQDCAAIDSIVIVTRKDLIDEVKKIQKTFSFTKIAKIVEGGEERQDSVFNGARAVSWEDADILVIHNGANPLVKSDEISACIEGAKGHGAAVCAFPLKDTIKKIQGGFVKETLLRDGVWQMQTPQCVRHDLFMKAIENAEKNKLKVTDDAALVEAAGAKVKIVPCSYENFKITTPSDLEMARKIIGSDGQRMLVGMGQDSHRFSLSKKPLILGGHTVLGELGLEANSDGDVILHALFNAISSALGRRSLGVTSDEMCKKGIVDSKEYLSSLLDEMKKKNIRIGNLSIAIEAKKPKLEGHHDKIKDSLCRILGVAFGQVGLTFTSGEGLTAFGRGEGMQCFCIVTLMR